MGTYAASTEVSSDKSITEIRNIVTRWGADQFGLMFGTRQAQVAFTYQGVNVRFILPLPDRTKFTLTPTGRERAAKAQEEAYEQAVRQKWRALALVVKAKLEAVDSEISTFEHEFLAHIVLPDGRTVFDSIAPQVAAQIQSGSRAPLMLES